MLSFPKEYFQDEYRDGFLVESTMKSAWAAQLEVLKKIEAICKRHDLQYFAFFGTLLGAIRHGGYIPWDDDIDIAMKRRDYLKFLEVAREELPPEYKFLTIYDEEEWHEVNARITNSSYIDISENRLREYHGCPFSVGVDIYPLDYMPDDVQALELQINIMQLIAKLDALAEERETLAERGVYTGQQEGVIREGLAMLEKLYGVKFSGDRSLRNQLFRLYDRLCIMYGSEKDTYMTVYPSYLASGHRIKFLKQWLGESVSVPFETTTIEVPNGHEACLYARFGKFYMTPLQIAAAHDYPFYKMQKEILQERGIWNDLEQLASRILEERDFSEKNIIGNTGDTDSKRMACDEVCSGEAVWGVNCSNGRKVICFRMSVVEFLVEGEAAMRKLQNTLQVFRESCDVIHLWWRVDKEIRPTLEILYPDMVPLYDTLVADYIAEAWGVFDTLAAEEEVVNTCAGYYGDFSGIVKKFQMAGKPVMIESCCI